MGRNRVLFQGSYRTSGGRHDTAEQLETARAIAAALGQALIVEGLDLVLTGARSLDAEVGAAAEKACRAVGADPRERICTFLFGPRLQDGFGIVLRPLDRVFQDVRTFVVQEVDAVVAVLGGRGTSDVLQKACLARKPVFPIAIAGGGAQQEWERLRRTGYHNRSPGDLDYLADVTAKPEELAQRIVRECKTLLADSSTSYSKRVFIVHGRDSPLKSQLARTLERLELEPVILHEQADRGQTILAKLQTELADVGFAFVLLTPDDIGSLREEATAPQHRARQNVIFEHGLLIGHLGSHRVCAIVSGDIEIPSDLHGLVYKHLPRGADIDAILHPIVRELLIAGYDVDANRLYRN